MALGRWLVTLVGAAVLAGTAEAGSVNDRQVHQRQRIRQGVRSGELTRHEAALLRAEQARIRREERRYRHDGRLGPRERADLRRDLDRASRHIYRQKHDGQDRD